MRRIGRFSLVCAMLLLLPRAPRAEEVAITILQTSDVHGHVEPERAEIPLAGGRTAAVERGGLALVGGYVANARAAAAARGAHVVLVDSGDMLQGTLVSNLGEGRAVVRAMNALGYAAAAVGNHEFDFGPVGPHAIAESPSEDPRGALAARAGEARFPWLTANIVDARGRPPGAPSVKRFTIVDVAGVKLGIVGGTSEDTPRTTI